MTDRSLTQLLLHVHIFWLTKKLIVPVHVLRVQGYTVIYNNTIVTNKNKTSCPSGSLRFINLVTCS